VRSVRAVTELLARKTGRRGLLGRGAQVATGALIGAAAGKIARPVFADRPNTKCFFPGDPCPCEGCSSTTGACQKPCLFLTLWYASGCWVAVENGATCCDCHCPPFIFGYCGCGTDYHTANCPAS
jgi:hypothetical protein